MMNTELLKHKGNEGKNMKPSKLNLFLTALIALVMIGGTPLGGTAQAKTESASLIDAIDSFGQVVPGVGWIVFDGRLYWTGNDGAAWRDISPDSSRIESVSFLDARRGWVVLSGAEGFRLVSTRDGGRSWDAVAMDLSALGKVEAPVAQVFMRWDSELRGWVSFRLATGNNFDRRVNYVTADGGATWTREDVWGGAESARGNPLEGQNEAGWKLSQSGECTSGACSREVILMSTRDGVQWTAMRLPNGQFSLTENFSAGPKAFTTDSDTKPYVGQGFDKCEMANLTQMQTWWNSSPYNAVNLYYGGVSRACANSLITPSFLSSLRAQGWRFIPTWVGLQASCTGYGHRMSSDPAVSYVQGKDEATAAIAAAHALGLTNPDGSGTVIYFDLEAYDTSNAGCRASANAFVNGWSEVMQAAGNLAGVYGASCGSAPTDWWSLAHVPDALWIANWYGNAGTVSYTRTATVWNAACLSNALWPNHQRLRQYAGTHTETWGGVAFSIDSNVLDGPLTVPNGTGDVAAPSQPANPNPADGASVTRTNDTWLAWRTNGDTCTVHVWGGTLDTNLVGDCATVHLGPQGPGAYAWQVTATNGFGSTLGPTWHFGIQPNPPTNLSAAPASSTRVNLNWTLSTDEPNVDGYIIFADGVQAGTVGAGVNSYQVQNLACSTAHSFTVRAVYQGIQSSESNTANASTGSCAPVLIAPVGGMLVNSVQPGFEWEAVSGAAYYQLQISTSTTFSTYVVNTRVYATTYTSTVALLANMTYHWRVRAIGSFGTGDWASASFTTPNPPPAPGLLTPASNALVTDTTPTFDWKDVTAPIGTTLDHYQIQVATDAAFTAPLVDADVVLSTFTPLNEFDPNMKYFWRVRAVNTLGHMGAWSKLSYFRSAILPPDLLSPADGASLLTLRPTFDFSDVAGASSYTVQVSASAAFTTVLKNYSSASSMVIAGSNLPANATLYWRARANGTNGPSLWSAVRSFTTPNPPSVPALLSPLNRATLADLTPRLAWKSVTVPAGTTFSHYQLQVSLSSTFVSLALDQSVFTLSPSEFTLVTPLLPGQKYYWRVMACNTDSACSAWSAVWSFSTASNAVP